MEENSMIESKSESIILTKEEFELISGDLTDVSQKEQAEDIMKKQGISMTEGIDDFVVVNVDGEEMKMSTYSKDFGTIIE